MNFVHSFHTLNYKPMPIIAVLVFISTSKEDRRIEYIAKNLPVGSVVNDIELNILADMFKIDRTTLFNGLTKYLSLQLKRQTLINGNYVNFYSVRLKSKPKDVSGQN
jgi:hypothetical protein